MEESGPTKEVLDNPKNVRTKEFIQKVLENIIFYILIRWLVDCKGK